MPANRRHGNGFTRSEDSVMATAKKMAAVIGLVGGMALAGCASVPPDDANKQQMQFTDLAGTRYTEILVVFGNALTKDFTAGVYNTVGLNGSNPVVAVTAPPRGCSTLSI